MVAHRLNTDCVPRNVSRIDAFIPMRMLSLMRVPIIGYQKTMKGNAMTAPMDDTRRAFGRQVSVAYLPTVREPLPRELKDLVIQLVAFEVCKRGSSGRPTEALQLDMAQLTPDPHSTDPSVRR